MNDQVKLNFFASAPEPCSYLDNRKSVSAFANPHMDMDMDIDADDPYGADLTGLAAGTTVQATSTVSSSSSLLLLSESSAFSSGFLRRVERDGELGVGIDVEARKTFGALFACCPLSPLVARVVALVHQARVERGGAQVVCG